MSLSQPTIRTADGKRDFTCFAAAVLVFIVNEREEFLLLAHPKRHGWWEVVNGGMDAGETISEAAVREAHEEAGADLQVRPLGSVHVQNFHFDENVPYMFSISYLVAYQGGDVVPGDDMAGSQARWFRLDALMADDVKVIVPPHQKWLFGRAVDLYRLWKDADVDLQPPLRFGENNKYDLEEGDRDREGR